MFNILHLQVWRGTLSGLSRLRLPDLRHPPVILHPASGHDLRVLQDLQSCQKDSSWGAPRSESPWHFTLLSGNKVQYETISTFWFLTNIPIVQIREVLTRSCFKYKCNICFWIFRGQKTCIFQCEVHI